jgi:hypothetical protein
MTVEAALEKARFDGKPLGAVAEVQRQSELKS